MKINSFQKSLFKKVSTSVSQLSEIDHFLKFALVPYASLLIYSKRNKFLDREERDAVFDVHDSRSRQGTD